MIRAPQHRAVITGMGVVSALGVGRDAFWTGLQSERSPVRPLTLFDVSASNARHAAWVENWDARPWIAPHRLKRMDRCVQFAVSAARMAVQDAGIELTPERPNPRAGVSVGTALGGFGTGELTHTSFLENGSGSLPPSLGLQVFPGSAQGNLAIEFGLQGPGTTNANTCAAGNVALADALRFIQLGKADVIVAGAAEAPITPMIYGAFDRMGTMAAARVEQPYRPYHRERDGFVMGEGAAFFIVESLAHAQARGARVYAEIMGTGATNEAHHMSTPDAAGTTLQTAMRLALEEAEVAPDQIDYINPHASGTQANDVNELHQLRAVFGGALDRIAISGTKPFTGHTLGCAGAMEAFASLLAMQHDWVPPTLGLDDPDPASVGFPIVANHGQSRPVRRVLTNSLGFGGINTSLVLGTV
jgi:3-oxoacyl-[acyl-carrier-protein] synthase II